MHKSQNVIEKPIILVGIGRSGTTILYNLLAGHPELGWFSNYNVRLPPLTFLSAISRFYGYPSARKWFGRTRAFPRPSEGYAYWEAFHPEVHSASRFKTALTQADASGMDLERMRTYVAKLLRYSGKSRFLNKNTRNTLRIPYLHSLFPDASFIHIVRDGRAVTNSLLKVPWWPDVRLWWADERRPPDLEREGMDPVLIAARAWTKTTQRALDDADCLPPERYLEIRYENFTENVITEISRILDFCGLSWTPRFEAHVKSFDISTQNYKWKRDLSPENLAVIENECRPLLTALGYE